MDFQIVWKGSPNFWFGRNGHKVKSICFHGTGSPQNPLRDDLGDVDTTFAAADGPSTHFAIGRDGSIHQYVDTKNAAWGNGIFDDIGPDPNVAWLMDCWQRDDNPNYSTISIETKNDTSNSQGLTEIQYQALLWLTKKLLAENPQIPLDRNSGLLGHYQIQRKGRARCPGPNFPWARLLNDLKGATPVTPAPQPQPQNNTNQHFFAETGFWIINDGQARFLDEFNSVPFKCIGFPKTGMYYDQARKKLVQWFERARLEYNQDKNIIEWGLVGDEARTAGA